MHNHKLLSFFKIVLAADKKAITATDPPKHGQWISCNTANCL